MGYFTRYRLTWDTQDNPLNHINSLIGDYIHTHERFGIDESGEPLDEAKWYEHEEDMIALSRQFPSTEFVLEGEGEESGDIWRKRFRNGRVEWSRIPRRFSSWRTGPMPASDWKGDKP